MIDSDFNVKNHSIAPIGYTESFWQLNSCASDRKVKEVFIESIALCLSLNQTADSLWFTDALCSMKIKSHLIYREEKNLSIQRKAPKIL